MARKRSPLLEKLTGGDRRQIGRSNDVAKAVLKKPATFADLFSGLTDPDALVRMRSADAAEKVTQTNPQLLEPHKAELLHILESTDEQEVAWHASVMAPRITLTKRDRKRVRNRLESFLKAKSRIQRVMALQGLSDLAAQEPSIIKDVSKLIDSAMTSEAPSVRARARKLKTQIEHLILIQPRLFR